MTLWLIVAIGVGLIGYGGYQWVNRTQLSQKQLEGSVELNYQLDIARMRRQAKDGELNLSKEWKRQHRAAIREQIQAHLEKETKTAKSWMIAGLAALVFSLGRIFLVPMVRNKD